MNFNWLYVRNKIETMYGRSDVNVKVERGFTFTRGFSHIVSFIYARKANSRFPRYNLGVEGDKVSKLTQKQHSTF